MKKESGFTLIELLIVVAIIGILAAIAVPNFLNAQTRAKVARCYSDMKALSTGFEMYQIDNNSYPWGGGTIWASYFIYPRLTTPVSYLATIPQDVFVLKSEAQRPEEHGLWYPGWNVYQVVKQGWTWGGDTVKNAVASGSHMLTVSSGPDKHEDISSTGLNSYNTSNGLLSDGDIYRFTPGQQGDS